jgi:hypothetical protein
MSFAMRMVGLIFFTLLRFHATCSFGLIWLAGWLIWLIISSERAVFGQNLNYE